MFVIREQQAEASRTAPVESRPPKAAEPGSIASARASALAKQCLELSEKLDERNSYTW